MSLDEATVFFIFLLMTVGSLYTVFTFFSTYGRVFIHSYDIYNNLKYLMKDKTCAISYKKLVLSIVLLSSLSMGLYYTKRRETFSYFTTIFILFIPSLGFLMKTVGTIIKNHLEIISEFIAGVRYEKSSSSKWKLEQEQWLLLLDLINTSESKGETLITVDASICGKDQPLTLDNQWKLQVLDYKVENLGESPIRLRYALPMYL